MKCKWNFTVSSPSLKSVSLKFSLLFEKKLEIKFGSCRIFFYILVRVVPCRTVLCRTVLCRVASRCATPSNFWTIWPSPPCTLLVYTLICNFMQITQYTYLCLIHLGVVQRCWKIACREPVAIERQLYERPHVDIQSSRGWHLSQTYSDRMDIPWKKKFPQKRNSLITIWSSFYTSYFYSIFVIIW